MKYLLEDRRRSTLSQFLLRAYTDDGKNNIIFTGGNGELLKKTHSILKSGPNENVVIFIDTVPENEETINTYNALALYAQKCKNEGNLRVMVIPIVCAEYYIIISLGKLGVIDTTTPEYLAVTGELDWREQINKGIITVKDDVITFERYCKWFMSAYATGCINITEPGSNNPESRTYYLEDCQCGYNCGSNNSISVENKALHYARQYPCFPNGILQIGAVTDKVLNVQDMVELNHELCDYFNKKIPVRIGGTCAKLLPIFTLEGTKEFEDIKNDCSFKRRLRRIERK